MRCLLSWHGYSPFVLRFRRWALWAWKMGAVAGLLFLITACSVAQLQVQVESPVRELAVSEEATILLAAGDIARCTLSAKPHYRDTADLADKLPGTLALLGDSVYLRGSHKEFADCFDPYWGRHKARIHPVPGNHEYKTPGAAGYYTYFGAAASPLDSDCTQNCKGYYSYDLGDWHIVALNSQRSMDIGSEQERWLRKDLETHPNVCTLAYWHHARYSSGLHGDDKHSMGVWRTLFEFGADVVLTGHDHHYERFAPQNAAGKVDEKRGIRQFVVGTGGTTLTRVKSQKANSEVYNDSVWGLLQLSLYPNHYSWKFVPIAGSTYEDSGSAPCVTLED
jgi:3',5'-cyclic AMP phosphodiesterase CpdA